MSNYCNITTPQPDTEQNLFYSAINALRIAGQEKIADDLDQRMENLQSKILLSRKELADRWGLCIETLKRWEKSGKLPFLKIGKQVRYRLSAIQDIELETAKN